MRFPPRPPTTTITTTTTSLPLYNSIGASRVFTFAPCAASAVCARVPVRLGTHVWTQGCETQKHRSTNDRLCPPLRAAAAEVRAGEPLTCCRFFFSSPRALLPPFVQRLFTSMSTSSSSRCCCQCLPHSSGGHRRNPLTTGGVLELPRADWQQLLRGLLLLLVRVQPGTGRPLPLPSAAAAAVWV